MDSNRSSVLAYLTIDVDAVTWTPLTALIDCDYFSILNTPGGWFGFGAQSATLRTSLYDVNSEKPLVAGNQEIVSATPRGISGPRFRQGDLLVFVKADAGTASLILTCVR